MDKDNLIKLLSKDNLIKLVVVAVVLAFAFEIIAIYGLSGNGQATPGNNEPIESTYEGSVNTRLTVDSYEPVLRIVGNDTAGIARIAKGLKDEGIATYYVKPEEGMLLLNLKKADDVIASAERFGAVNATAYSRAFFSLPAEVNISVEGVGEIPVAPATIRDEVMPRFEVGDELSGQFPARVVGIAGGEYSLVAWGSIVFLPSGFANASSVATVIGTETLNFEVNVPWGKRNFDKAGIEKEFADFEYAPKSYVVFEGGITSDRQAEISGRGLEYVAAVFLDALSVSGNFTDEARIREDLAGYSLSFPESKLVVRVNGTKNVSVSGIEEKIAGALGGNYTAKEYSLVRFTLPSSLEISGKNYTLAQEEGFAYFEGEYAEGQEIPVLMQGTTLGKEVYSVDYIRKAE